MKEYILYKTVNKINNRFYIGVHKQTPNLRDSYLGSGEAIKNAISKYGVDNFERITLKTFSSEEEAYKEEGLLVTRDFLKDNPECYNIMPGGKGGFDYINSCPEIRVKSEKSLLSRYGHYFKDWDKPYMYKKKRKGYTDKYGLEPKDWPLLSKEAQRKSKDTHIEKYGGLMTQCHTTKSREKQKLSRKKFYEDRGLKCNHYLMSEKSIKKSVETKRKKGLYKNMPMHKYKQPMNKLVGYLFSGDEDIVLECSRRSEEYNIPRSSVIKNLDPKRVWVKEGESFDIKFKEKINSSKHIVFDDTTGELLLFSSTLKMNRYYRDLKLSATTSREA